MGLWDRLFGKKAPPPPPPTFDTSEANLRAVLGDANVKHATGLAAKMVLGDADVSDADARDQVGGVPANIGADTWPHCEMCHTPLTFIAQVACGPDEVPRYPERGSLAIFLCNSEPPTNDRLCLTADGSGTAVFFVGPEPSAALMFSAEQLRAIAAMQTRAVAHTNDRTAPYPRPFLLPAVNGYRGRPVINHRFRVERHPLLSCNDPFEKSGRELYYAFMEERVERERDVAIEIDAFPDWIQAPQECICICGAPMELVVQFDCFDDAINLGDAGRAYVFACTKRCGPRSFLVRWDCC